MYTHMYIRTNIDIDMDLDIDIDIDIYCCYIKKAEFRPRLVLLDLRVRLLCHRWSRTAGLNKGTQWDVPGFRDYTKGLGV